MLRRLISRVADRILYDTPETGARAPVRGAGERTPGAPDSSDPMAMLSAATPDAVLRVVRLLEARRAGLREPRTGGAIDTTLASLRPAMRRCRPPRIPSLSRLAWIPVEPLLKSGPDPRPWSVDRSWLVPAWRLVLDYAGPESDELARQLEILAARAAGAPAEPGSRFALSEQDLRPIAQAVQRMTGASLARALGERDLIRARLAVLISDAGLDRNVSVDDLLGALDRLSAGLRARAAAGDLFDDLARRIEFAMSAPGWRQDASLMADILRDLTPLMARLGAGLAAEDVSRSPAAALLILLARHVSSPWLLLEASRRRTMLNTAARSPLDSWASPEDAALAEDLVRETERLSRLGETLIARINPRSPEADLADQAVRAVARLSSWLHGLLGSGFLDPQGLRHRRCMDARKRLMVQPVGILIPALETMAASPYSLPADTDSDAASLAVEDGASAIRSLRQLVAAPDALGFRQAASRALRDSVTQARRAGEACVRAAERGEIVADSSLEASLRTLAALDPAAGEALARRIQEIRQLHADQI